MVRWITYRWTRSRGRISATLALIYPPGIGESFNRFPGFNYEVQGRVSGAG